MTSTPEDEATPESASSDAPTLVSATLELMEAPGLAPVGSLLSAGGVVVALTYASPSFESRLAFAWSSGQMEGFDRSPAKTPKGIASLLDANLASEFAALLSFREICLS